MHKALGLPVQAVEVTLETFMVEKGASTMLMVNFSALETPRGRMAHP